MPLAVCATPIGNLDDISLRVLAELSSADVILAEDTRHTRGLLERHGIKARLLSYHEHNEAARVAELLPRLAAGERQALVRRRGPSRHLRSGHAPGARRTRRRAPRDGPARAVRGRDGAGRERARGPYAFVGFLPRGKAALAAFWQETASWGTTLVAFESPKRLPATLRALAAAEPAREVAVCRELTKRFEEIARGTARELAERFAEPPKGEITLVVAAAPRPAGGVDLAVPLAAVAELVAAGTPRRVAAEVVGRLTDVSRNDLYRGTL